MLLLALLSAGVNCFAQRSKSEADAFEISTDHFRRQFFFDLGDGNKMELKLTEKGDIDSVKDIESVLLDAVSDIFKVSDSVYDKLTSKKIFYTIDGNNLKKIRIQTWKDNSVRDYIIIDDKPGRLKILQDTLIITKELYTVRAHSFFTLKPEQHYYRIILSLNNLRDLGSYMGGTLNAKVKTLQTNLNSWVYKNGAVRLKADSSIYAAAKAGNISGGDIFIVRGSIDAQNYKSYFVPSISLSLSFVSNKEFIRRELGVGTEFHFLFSKNAERDLRTRRNLFVVMSYGKAAIDTKGKKVNGGAISLYPYLSFGWLVDRRGNYYDKHTVKLGWGRLALFGGSTKVEPTFYFHDFFKEFTPSLRVVQQF